jgi:hypothetical protein
LPDLHHHHHVHHEIHRDRHDDLPFRLVRPFRRGNFHDLDDVVNHHEDANRVILDRYPFDWRHLQWLGGLFLFDSTFPLQDVKTPY